MQDTFLEKVLSETRERVAAAKALGYGNAITSRARKVRERSTPNAFRSALSAGPGPHIIAEIKRASPSKGVIDAAADVKRITAAYSTGGAAAISVLTEPNHFKGSISDLRTACEASRLPVLRKDFIVDEYQVFEAAAVGASAVLLIVAALSDAELNSLGSAAADIGMDTLVEVHSEPELNRARSHGFDLIGINNRNLDTLQVSLDVSRELIAERRRGEIMVAESGIKSADDVSELHGLGFSGFLIGESLMRSGDPAGALRSFALGTK